MALTPIRRRGAAVHAHRDVRLLAVVFAGGACGTAIRSLLEDAFARPTPSWPWTTFGINVIGAFVLGLLLEALVRSGADTGRRRLVRLGMGTGVLGGFTTYSTFAVETVERLTQDSLVVGLAYPVASGVLGVTAAAVGYRIAHRLRRHGHGTEEHA